MSQRQQNNTTHPTLEGDVGANDDREPFHWKIRSHLRRRKCTQNGTRHDTTTHAADPLIRMPSRKDHCPNTRDHSKLHSKLEIMSVITVQEQLSHRNEKLNVGMRIMIKAAHQDRMLRDNIDVKESVVCSAHTGWGMPTKPKCRV